MGHWSVTEVRGQFADYDTQEQYGNRFVVTIRLRHEPSAADRSSSPPLFTETPLLEWNEVILFKDLTAHTFWEWEGDLYSYKPGARTFKAWRRRYLEAYERAAGSPTHFDFLNGKSELTVNGVPVTLRQLLETSPAESGASRFLSRIRPAGGAVTTQRLPTNEMEKAAAVRRFIQRNSCELVVEILDRPGIGISQAASNYATMRKERLLRFDCGAGGHRIKAHQILLVDVPAGRHAWRRSAALGWAQTSLSLQSYHANFAGGDILNPRQSEFDYYALGLGDSQGLTFGEFR
jgi:hypothetical protein